MKLPLLIHQNSYIRIFACIAVVVAATTLPLSAGTAQLTCTPSSLRFGSVPIGQTETQTVVLANGGQTSVKVSAIDLSGTQFSLSKVSLPLTLAAGQSVAVSVSLSPTISGWTQGVTTFTSNASNPKIQLELAGSGAKSDGVVANPSSVSFGQVTVGKSSTRAVVVTNTRSWKVKVSALYISGSGFSVSGPTLPISVGKGQSFTMNVTFGPKSAGAAGGSVFVSGANLNVPLNGTGANTTTTTAGQLTIAPSLVNFGQVEVGTTVTQPITMSATGASVTVSSDASSNAQFVLNGASLPFTIAAGQSVSFNVGFTPKSSGTVSGSLAFTSNASTTQMVESLTGTGTVQQYSVSLSWNPSSGVAGYNVYRSTSATGTYSRINSTLDPNTAYTDSSVATGATYYYEASSVDAKGQESARSTPPVKAIIP